MTELALSWYSLLSSLSATVALPLRELADSTNASILSALVFGLIGATSPCQITTNVSAMAFLLRGDRGGSSPTRATLAYLLGKAIIYTLLGTAAILVGRQFEQASIPLVAAVRKLVGPAMVILALYLFGLLPLRFTVGARLAGWVEGRAGSGSGGAFLLGTAFALAFCPTLFLLFFGITVPLALASPAGLLYPAVFAVGTAVPLLSVIALLAIAAAHTTRDGTAVSRASRKVAMRLQPLAAVVILLAGLNDTWLYWLV